jgi:hypothetical protein
MIGGSVLSCFVVLYLFGRRNERAVRRDWQLLLTPKGEDVYRTIEGRVQSEMELANLTYDEAFSFRELGSVEEAKVSAMAPVTPLRPRDFRLTEIASLAYLNGLVHQFLVSTAERFRLRVYILGQSFGLATRALLRSTKRIAGGEPEAEREWDQVDAVRQDFDTLTRDSLDTLRVLLTSLGLEQREQVLRKLQE